MSRRLLARYSTASHTRRDAPVLEVLALCASRSRAAGSDGVPDNSLFLIACGLRDIGISSRTRSRWYSLSGEYRGSVLGERLDPGTRGGWPLEGFQNDVALLLCREPVAAEDPSSLWISHALLLLLSQRYYHCVCRNLNLYDLSIPTNTPCDICP